MKLLPLFTVIGQAFGWKQVWHSISTSSSNNDGLAFAGGLHQRRVDRRASRASMESQSSGARGQRTLLRMEEVECDVVIVGGGPAGCTCALYTSRADHKTVILDKNPSTGALAITHTIANYPGVDRTMSGQALLDQMREQAIQYGTDYRRAQVFLIDFDDGNGNKIVYTPDATFKTRSLVLATGAMGRKPTFKGEDTYLGQGVSYCATCDGAFYRDCEVAIVGSNQEAIDEAQFLTKFASTVHWVTQIDPDNENAKDLLAHPNVKHWSQTRLLKIDGDKSGVTGMKLKKKGEDETEIDVPVEGVFIYVAGSKPITDYVGGKLELNKDGGVPVDDEMSTSIDGVFAIGDIRNTPYKQVVVAASDGCISAMAIDKYLKGRKSIRVDWIHQ
uniref:FAD/NAD(P)-binding domain-containing protein n=2 Tax=Eucampia antarctica TaxID=49252 RepID=A0A7S2VXY7_9STRA|mmetsp:Transcript_11067/g.10597  ORF Transcript_11067/g.10597 Transcript_11067/m.10597 type:complete len:388 (+) Transcript_11067:68-1231(+)|eukprot:CAMPEP_0197834268 /NCGR_PEP_ID=MMETSP1437-20131217/21826_1 /TAXON_ID=49252 ORGANISM="Eucampia antarctica, Strain CCMP1452" /NCGR_SAMPLE_ID=MMETSP1437 /ASSEMBLY_ACC=CAM_ASM_001096 /LENGTH=387 /DNA_ID=CAMNT_0043438827 /DNA_START=56 /DNA_END=1219 /DNA_ORIENTATION=+